MFIIIAEAKSGKTELHKTVGAQNHWLLATAHNFPRKR